MRFGIALALLIGVLFALYVAPVLRQLPNNFPRSRADALNALGAAADHKSLMFHAEGTAQ